jgi:hypothetical protein
MAAQEYFPLKSGEFGLFSFSQKSLYESLDFFCVAICKNAQN